MISEFDLKHLRRTVELAKAALDKGDEPFALFWFPEMTLCFGKTTTTLPVATTPSTRNLLWHAGLPRT